MSDSGGVFVLSKALRGVEHLTRTTCLRTVNLSPDHEIEIGAMGATILSVAIDEGEVAVSTSQADLLVEMRSLIDRGLLSLIDETVDAVMTPQRVVSRAKATPDGLRVKTLLAFDPIELPVIFRVRVEYEGVDYEGVDISPTLTALDVAGP